MIRQNFLFFCWYGSLNYNSDISRFEKVSISLKNFWTPSNSWPIYYKKYKKDCVIPSLNKTVCSLKFLFKFFFYNNCLFSFKVLPKKHVHTTVTRGPMVRKKQSREQVSSIYSFNSLNICLLNFFSFFICKSFYISLSFLFFLVRSIKNFSSLLDLLLLQQFSITLRLNLSVFFTLL